jgi:hypothetical protein
MPKLGEYGPKARQDFPPLMKASDLKEPTTYTVKAVRVATLKGESKPIFSFQEDPKEWVVNKTNAAALMKKFGDVELSVLVGLKVTLASVGTSYQGEQTEGIRVVGFPA